MDVSQGKRDRGRLCVRESGGRCVKWERAWYGGIFGWVKGKAAWTRGLRGWSEGCDTVHDLR